MPILPFLCTKFKGNFSHKLRFKDSRLPQDLLKYNPTHVVSAKSNTRSSFYCEPLVFAHDLVSVFFFAICLFWLMDVLCLILVCPFMCSGW